MQTHVEERSGSLSSSQIQARAKNPTVNSLATASDWITLQEAHGTDADLRARCRQVAENLWRAFSQGPNHAVGGTMTLTRKEWLDAAASTQSIEVFEGRILKMVVELDDRKLTVWHIAKSAADPTAKTVGCCQRLELLRRRRGLLCHERCRR